MQNQKKASDFLFVVGVAFGNTISKKGVE